MAWFIGDFQRSDVPAVRWLAAQLVLFHRGPLVQVLLTYPGGRAIGLAERGGVGLGYVAALAPQLWTDPASSVVLAVLFAGIAVHGAAISRAIARRVRIVAAGVAVQSSPRSWRHGRSPA